MTTSPDLVDRLVDGDVPRPRRARHGLSSYAALVGAYGAAFLGAAALARRRNVVVERLDVTDLIPLGVAAHKLSRLLTREKVTMPIRSPFVEGPVGGDPKAERPRGEGLRYALGELVTCPYCVSGWVSSALCYGMVFAPRETRLATNIFTVEAIADFLHVAFTAAKSRA